MPTSAPLTPASLADLPPLSSLVAEEPFWRYPLPPSAMLTRTKGNSRPRQRADARYHALARRLPAARTTRRLLNWAVLGWAPVAHDDTGVRAV